jgi:hypothetical protein
VPVLEGHEAELETASELALDGAQVSTRDQRWQGLHGTGVFLVQGLGPTMVVRTG